MPASRAVIGTLPPPALARGSSTSLDRSAGAATAIARIRRPRWTPSGIKLSSDQAKHVSGEIDLVDPTDE